MASILPDQSNPTDHRYFAKLAKKYVFPRLWQELWWVPYTIASKTMTRVFYYASKPGLEPPPDTPFRRLELQYHEGRGWLVSVFPSPPRDGRDRNPISEEPFESFEAGEIFLNRMARELQTTGWREYIQHEGK